jgi:hypothetical protein
VRLHLTLRLRPPPHLTATAPDVRHVEGDIAEIAKAFDSALNDADLAGAFRNGGCLDVIVQAARLESQGS